MRKKLDFIIYLLVALVSILLIYLMDKDTTGFAGMFTADNIIALVVYFIFMFSIPFIISRVINKNMGRLGGTVISLFIGIPSALLITTGLFYAFL